MNRKYFLALVLFMGVLMGLASCSETNDDTEEYPDWQKKNSEYFQNIFSQALADIEQNGENSQWDTIRCWSLNDTVARLNPTDYIVVHKIVNGTGSGCPLYTDSVMVHNLGKLLPSTSYPNGYVIEKSWDGDFNDYNATTAYPKKWAVSGLIDGYTTALMRMHIGDRWQVYVPWTLGYGTTAYNSIPAYSVLVWDITLLGYYRPGAEQPSIDAKKNNSNLWITE